MYTEISFPSLGIAIDPSRTLTLGPLTIHYYGLIIACGLMLAVFYCSRRCRQRSCSKRCPARAVK